MAEQKGSDATSDILWIIFAVVLVLGLIWWKFGDQITYYFLTYKLIQINLINSFFPTNRYLELAKAIQDTNIGDWKVKELYQVGSYVGYIFNIPLGIILSVWGWKVYSKNPSKRFKRVLTMQTLKDSEKKIWPYISPVVNVDLMKEDFKKGPYALSMKPYDFALKYHLLTEEKNVNSLDRKKAEKLFISQLGKPFSGFNKLRTHEKVLLCVMAAHGLGKKKEAMNAVYQLAINSANTDILKMPDMSFAKDLYKFAEDPQIVEIMNKHAYVYTLLAQMLEFSRTTGVFPSNFFVWLKTRDRVLWYTLNCVGRQVPFVEIAGIFGHWRAEQIAKHKLDAPYVIKAVDGLEKALTEVKIE